MSITLRHAGLPEGLGRSDVLGLIRAIRPALRLSSLAVNLLIETILRTQEQDYEAGQICCAWPTVDTLADGLGKSPRAINRAENELSAAGLVERTSMTNGRRFGSREKGDEGVVLRAAGLNLQPLIARFVELSDLRDRIQLERKAIRACRDEIKDAMKTVRWLDAKNGDERIREILPRGRPSEVKDYEEIVSVRDALVAVCEELAATVDQPKMADAPEKNGRPYTKDKTISKSCTRETVEISQPDVASVSLGQAMLIASDDFKEKAEQYYAGRGVLDWEVMACAAGETCNELGISQYEWHDALRCLGSYVASLCVIVIERNHRRKVTDSYHLRNPHGALFRLRELGIAASGSVGRLAGPLLREAGGHGSVRFQR